MDWCRQATSTVFTTTVDLISKIFQLFPRSVLSINRSVIDNSMSPVFEILFILMKYWKAMICRELHNYWHGPLARNVNLRFAHDPDIPGTVSPPPRVSDPDMLHDTSETHVSWCMPGLLTSGFFWSRWQGNSSRHSRRMHNPQFPASGTRPIYKYAQQLLACTRNLHDNYHHNCGCGRNGPSVLYGHRVISIWVSLQSFSKF